jgi:hypothetical protein
MVAGLSLFTNGYIKVVFQKRIKERVIFFRMRLFRCRGQCFSLRFRTDCLEMP